MSYGLEAITGSRSKPVFNQLLVEVAKQQGLSGTEAERFAEDFKDGMQVVLAVPLLIEGGIATARPAREADSLTGLRQRLTPSR